MYKDAYGGMKNTNSLVRHFTVTGFMAHDDYLALHWHAKVLAWLPPGGHINENEDPIEAVVREIWEETGVNAEVVSTGPGMKFRYPLELPPPFTIMVEDIDDPEQGYHQHIDLIYMCRPVGSFDRLNDGWLWVSKEHLNQGKPLLNSDGVFVVPPEDVRVLARYAFEILKVF